MFDGKGIIVIKLRRFDNKASCSPESEKLYKVNMLVNIKGAETLAAELRSAVQKDIIDPYFDQVDQEKQPGLSMYLNNVNCIGYREWPKDAWIPDDKEPGNFDLKEAHQNPLFDFKIRVVKEADGKSATTDTPLLQLFPYIQEKEACQFYL